MGGCQVEGVHRSETGFGCFCSRRNFDGVDLEEPSRVFEISVVERAFQALFEEDCLGNNLEMNEGTSQEHSIGLFEKLEDA
jgi:hypothetical protein